MSAVERIEDCAVSTTSMPEMPAGWAQRSPSAWVARAFGDFWQHCLVAEGALDIATDEQLQLWDYAAVQLIVEEAGGRCSAFDGCAHRTRESFLATNGGDPRRRGRAAQLTSKNVFFAPGLA